MAALSEETEAIVKRLKAEGDLIRNSGTNSLRVLNVKLDKFDSLFSSINANMVEQTALLERQLGIAKQAETASKNQEQFDELKRTAPESKKNDNPRERKERKPNWVDKIPDMLGNGIQSAFTMKNLALGAAGAFVGYNLLKGAIDEKTGGGFTEFESGLVEFGRGLGELDMTSIQETFTTLGESVAGIAASLSSLTAAVEMITSIDWLTVVTAFASTISALTAYSLTLRTLNLFKGNPGGPRSPRNAGRSWLRRLLAGSAVAGVPAASTVLTNAGNRVDDVVPNPRATFPDRTVMGSMDVPNLDGAGAPKVVIDPPKQPNYTFHAATDIYTSNNTGRVLTGNARTAAENARLRRMPLPTLPSAVGGTDFKPAGGPRMYGINAREIADNFIKANKGRITAAIIKAIPGVVAKSVPVLGVFVGLGFMVWSISKADWTSALAEGVSLMLPGFTGLPLDIAAAATSVFNEVTGRTYLQWREDDRLVMTQIGIMMWDEYHNYMADAEGRKRREYDALPEADRAARLAEAEYIAGGGRGPRGMGENNTGTMSLGSYGGAPDNTLNQSPGFKGSYYAGPNGNMYFQPSPSNGGGMAVRIGRVSDLSATTGNSVNIGGTTPIVISSPSSHGGNHSSSVTVIGSGNPGEATRSLPGFVN